MPRPFFGIFVPDVFPQIAKHGHLFAGNVVGDGNARQFDDAALDGVHEREVAHRPGKERAFGIAGTAEEEWRGGQVDDLRDAELAIDGFQTGNPKTGGLVVLLCFFLVIPFEIFLVVLCCPGFSR